MESFGPVRVRMEMRNDRIQEKQEKDPRPKTNDSRQKRKFPEARTFFDGRNEQAPNGCRDHDTGGKSRQCPLYIVIQPIFHEIDAGCTQ